MYRTVIFDFDGTLCSSIATIIMAMQGTFAHFGRPVPTLSAITRMAASAPDLTQSFYMLDPDLGPLDDLTLQEWSEFYRKTYRASDAQSSSLYPGIVELLTMLSKRGVELIIVSNKSIESIRRSLKQFDIDTFFSEIYGDSVQHPPKPDPTVFERNILPSRPDHRLQDFLMVGDTETDFHFARACGIDMAWVEYGFGQLNADAIQQTRFQANTPEMLMHQLEGL
jgi:phosphoglycolate phosphatase